MTDREKVFEIIRLLKPEYPGTGTALSYHTPFELLVATVLSAQTTDIHVNKVSANLFKKYRTINDYASSNLESLQAEISSINFYKTKAKNIQSSAKIIIEKFNGEVPKTMNELTILPGVARKTANIILSNAYGINEGIAVDTHVKRVSNRLGISKNEDPVKIEKELMDITNRKDWEHLTYLLISHGRKICQAKKPQHAGCVLYDICPSNKI